MAKKHPATAEKKEHPQRKPCGSCGEVTDAATCLSCGEQVDK